jgi:hypothetical protein
LRWRKKKINRYFLLSLFIIFSVGFLYPIDVANQMASFLGNSPPEQARYVNNSGSIFYVLTVSDNYNSQETLIFWLDRNDKIERVSYRIVSKSQYNISSRLVQDTINEIRHESEVRVENSSGVPYGSYKYGEYLYKNYILTLRVDYQIPSTSVQSMELMIYINPIAPQEVNENGFIGIVIDGEITITSYTDSRKDIIIPNEIRGIKVTKIGKEAFANRRITSVIIPHGIISIGEKAFYMNALSNINIPNSVISIGGGAFWNNRLININIPNSVNTIGAGAFMDNIISTVSLPNLEIIETNVFARNQLTSITIPESVKIIRNGAFSSNRISEVVIGVNVEFSLYSDRDVFFRFVRYYNERNKEAGRYVLAEINSTWFKLD